MYIYTFVKDAVEAYKQIKKKLNNFTQQEEVISHMEHDLFISLLGNFPNRQK